MTKDEIDSLVTGSVIKLASDDRYMLYEFLWRNDDCNQCFNPYRICARAVVLEDSWQGRYKPGMERTIHGLGEDHWTLESSPIQGVDGAW